MANDFTISWTKSPTSGIKGYRVSLRFNGGQAIIKDVAQTNNKDLNGYSGSFSALTGIIPQAGDRLEYSVRTIDNAGTHTADSVASGTIVYPLPVAPAPPQGLTAVTS